MAIGKELENAFTAATFAEAGEFQTARQILDGSRRVLLALHDDHLPPSAVRCATNLCRRTNASLDVVLVPGAGQVPDHMQRQLDQLGREGIPWRVLRMSGELGTVVLNHVATQRGVHMVVVDTLERWHSGRGQSWQQLACPLVVAGNANASCKSI